MPLKDDHDATWTEFKRAVTMNASDLEAFLATDDSRKVGWKGSDGKGSGESVGHKEGRHLVDILRKSRADLTDEDYAHMAKAVAFIKRHLAQRPKVEDIETSKWRYSLMNWGHDPLR